jgi:uncharacterized membrane protein
VSGDALLTVLAMALITYATRAGGLWLMARLTPSPRVEAALEALPGALLVALVAPTVLARGPAEALAALAAGLVMARTGNVVLAMGAGVGLVVVLRGA